MVQPSPTQRAAASRHRRATLRRRPFGATERVGSGAAASGLDSAPEAFRSTVGRWNYEDDGEIDTFGFSLLGEVTDTKHSAHRDGPEFTSVDMKR